MAYADAVLALTPIAYWRLGEASGTTATDSSGNGYHGTYTGTPTRGAAGLLPFEADTAVDFPNSDSSYMASPTIAALGTAFSIAAIIKPDSTAAGAVIGCQGGTDDPYLQHVSADLRLFFRDSGGTQRNIITPANNVPSGTTAHVVATHDGTTARIYVDGAQKVSGTFSLSSITSRPWYVGRRGLTLLPFDGTVDEVALFNYALSPTQVTNLLTAMWSTSGSGALSGAGDALGAGSKHAFGSWSLSLSGSMLGSGEIVERGPGHIGTVRSSISVKGGVTTSITRKGDSGASIHHRDGISASIQ